MLEAPLPLHPFLRDKLHLVDGLSAEDLQEPELLSRFMGFLQDPAPWIAPDVEVQDLLIDGPHGDIPIRIYTPLSEPRASLLWVHGGGFTYGNLDMPEAHTVSMEIAHRSQSVVVSVDYRLANGGIHYPIPVDDVHAAWQWLKHRPIRPGVPNALGGASAGAAIALSVALRERFEPTRPDLLLLAYPFAHFPTPQLDDLTTAEMRALPKMLRFTPDGVEDMVRSYVGRITDIPPEALPGSANLVNLPPTYVILSEFDDLRGSGELLAKQLTESGVDTNTYLAAGMLHGHLNRTPSLAEVDKSLQVFSEAIITFQPARS